MPVNQIVFFDGQCTFCQKWVQFLLKRAPNEFYYASLQSDVAKNYLPESYTKNLDTIVLWRLNKPLLTQSDAVINILSQLKGIWGFARIFNFFPKKIRDSYYDFFARIRHKIFAKTSCPLITLEQKKYFL